MTQNCPPILMLNPPSPRAMRSTVSRLKKCAGAAAIIAAGATTGIGAGAAAIGAGVAGATGAGIAAVAATGAVVTGAAVTGKAPPYLVRETADSYGRGRACACIPCFLDLR